MRKKFLISLILFGLLLPRAEGQESKPSEIRLAWATYNAVSAVLVKFGWLDDDLKKDGVTTHWIQSTSSSTANQYLASGSVDFAPPAASSALLGRANGIPLKVIYIYQRPNWIQLVVKKNSSIQTVADLKGKKIAVTRGSDAFFFLARALEQAGLKTSDVQIVNLAHQDGHVAWERGDVDAWSALDPFLAQAELHEGARVLYQNPEFLAYGGTISVTEDFLGKYPQYVQRVLKQFDRARLWVIAHPDETAQILSDDAHVGLDVAKRELNRIDFTDHVGIPDDYHVNALKALVPVLIEEKLVKDGVDPSKVLADLIDAKPAQEALGRHNSDTAQTN
jgi:sulfonate transport system substrate-binding protein